MIHNIDQYTDTLLSSQVSVPSLEDALRIIKGNDELIEILDNPNVTKQEKHKVIDDLFAPSVKDFIFSLSQECVLYNLEEIIDAFISKLDAKNHIAEAVIYCTTPPDEEQLKGIRKFICKKENAREAKIKIVKDEDLIGGFIISTDSKEYDFSLKGKFNSIKRKVMTSARENGIDHASVIAVLRQDIRDFELNLDVEEIGTVVKVGDSIATVHGLERAMYGEIVVFDNGVKGMVQDIKRHHTGVILFGSDVGIHQGTKVKRTHKKAGTPVGSGFIGRVVNALGEPIDGRGEIPAEDYRPVEYDAASIVERKSVDTPMATGILSIDAMFPIGRGQRELIIGDRQTGKTSIAVDTILNQKGKDVICIYNAIGQKASSISKLVNTLKKAGAMDYTIIVASTASEPASLQYISPYAATALAEHFMYRGKDCLIVYDDLSKHAVAYRALSLLLERSPGREAYPGDVFYLHSRLLERSSKLSDELGGGSITALPIIETQAGDVSAYIPTNVISITDGQIFLESDLFFSGMRPAVNVGLSVSRVGGAAQTKAMKKAAGSLRIDLAQFREMEVFTQFSSDLDEETKAGLIYGKGLMELLKQPLGRPLSLTDMIVTLVAATNKCFVDIPIEKIKEFQMGLIDYVSTQYPHIASVIETQKILDDDTKESILNAVNEFKKVNNG